MQVTPHARLPAADEAQRILFAAGADLFPGGHFRSEAHVTRRISHLDRVSNADPRAGLAELLRQQNSIVPLTAEQTTHLKGAGAGNALFILTGQQPGLMGGPILWFYKALTCAALAREWTTKLNRPVIPIFWIAGDDSDLDECNHLELLDPDAAKVVGALRLSFPDAGRPLAMGERRVDPDDMRDLLGRLGKVWSPEIVAMLQKAYPAGSTLSSGFHRVAQEFLGKEGILFVDGYSPFIRTLARPVLERAVENWDTWHAALSKGTATAVAAGIPAQVEIRSGVVHAFALRGGERHRLFAERRESKNSLYLPDRPTHDLRGSLENVELTHDVFSRPLVAEAIFPVLGHVLGPAELRYFAQLSPLFLQETGDMPLLHSRMTAAMVPAEAFTAYQSEDLDLTELLRVGPSALRTHLNGSIWRMHPAASELSYGAMEKWLSSTRQLHDRHFKDRGPLARMEKEMQGSWKRYLRSLGKTTYANSAIQKESLFQFLRWLGNGMGQDRHLNLPSMINAIGQAGLAEWRACVDPTNMDLQVFKYGTGKSETKASGG